MSDSSKGSVHLLVLALVALGIGAGVYLINKPAIFGSKASSFPYAQVLAFPVCEGQTPSIKLIVKYSSTGFATPYTIQKQTGGSGSFEMFGSATANAGSEEMPLGGGDSLNVNLFETVDSQVQIGTSYSYKAINSSDSDNYESIPVVITGPDCVRGGPQAVAMQMPTLPTPPQVSPLMPVPSTSVMPAPALDPFSPTLPALPSIAPIVAIPSNAPVPSVGSVSNSSSIPPIPSIPPMPSALVFPSVTPVPVSSIPSWFRQVRCFVGEISRVTGGQLVCN